MENKPRIIRASLVAPLAALLPLIILAAAALVSPEMTGADLSDDAPVRAAGIIFFTVIPLSFPILAMAMAVIGFILSDLQKLTRKNLIYISVISSLIAGILFGLQSPFGGKDQLIGFFVFWLFTMSCLVCGALTWWHIATGYNNKTPKRAG
jgi:hypothetical protein